MKDQVQDAIETARRLAEWGVPIFLAKPGGNNKTGYTFPVGWEKTEPDPAVLDDWRPGMAVCAVMGHIVDGIDLDPRHGGKFPDQYMPHIYGTQSTPSGGQHHLVASMGVGSVNDLWPGVDVKAGREDGTGRGFLFLAPTERKSQVDGQVRSYEWTLEPNLDSLALVGADASGQDLKDQIEKSQNVAPAVQAYQYSGSAYEDLDSEHQKMARGYLQDRLEYWDDKLQDAKTWPEDRRDSSGRGWESLATRFAWTLALFAVSPWVPIDQDQAREKYNQILPQELANDPRCRGKWHSRLISRANESREDVRPPWEDFDRAIDEEAASESGLPMDLSEYGMASWIAEEGLGRRVAVQGGEWFEWDGRRWAQSSESVIRFGVAEAIRAAHERASLGGMDKEYMKKLATFKTDSKTRSVTRLYKDRMASQFFDHKFDTRADLLNVGNGVVDLRTGDLLPHDPKYMFKKVSEVDYTPGQTNADFEQVLSVLDPEVMDWMQIRFGQAATGHPTSDDVLPVGQGGGSNGKSTLLSVVREALGEFAMTASDKLLMGRATDHSTEQTDLIGMRLVTVDETPEGRALNVAVLKRLLGTSEMRARKIAQDTVSWKTTHSLFLVSNYLPRVAENDYGTVRRLALVKFDKTVPRNDGFRDRVTRAGSPVIQAALAWIVAGAVKWYQNGKQIPPYPEKVRRDTTEWLLEADPTNQYIEERFVVDPDSAVLLNEVAEDLNMWLEANSMHSWSNQLSASRLAQSTSFVENGVRQVRATRTKALLAILSTRSAIDVPSKPKIYRGIRWRGTDEPMGFGVEQQFQVPNDLSELI